MQYHVIVLTLQKLQIVQYHLIVLLRLLGSLPPSLRYMESLDSDAPVVDHAFVLHTLRWTPRLAHPAFESFVKVRRANSSLIAMQCTCICKFLPVNSQFPL